MSGKRAGAVFPTRMFEAPGTGASWSPVNTCVSEPTGPPTSPTPTREGVLSLGISQMIHTGPLPDPPREVGGCFLEWCSRGGGRKERRGTPRGDGLSECGHAGGNGLSRHTGGSR